MITIIDYGMGNAGSLENMVHRVGGVCRISSNPEDVRSASKLILPGVGAFDNGMRALAERGLADALHSRVRLDGIPILCICLGMQMIGLDSEEGSLPGLGWVQAHTVRFAVDKTHQLRVPHMGWNTITKRKESPLLDTQDKQSRFYFVHSYHVKCADEADILTTSIFGIEFTSSIQKGNIFATQFHPEKSLRFGLQMIRNFLSV